MRLPSWLLHILVTLGENLHSMGCLTCTAAFQTAGHRVMACSCFVLGSIAFSVTSGLFKDPNKCGIQTLLVCWRDQYLSWLPVGPLMCTNAGPSFDTEDASRHQASLKLHILAFCTSEKSILVCKLLGRLIKISPNWAHRNVQLWLYVAFHHTLIIS